MNKEEEKNPKTIILDMKLIISSAISLSQGIGTFHDLTTVAYALKYCENSIAKNPGLGFEDDVKKIHDAVADIFVSVSRHGTPRPDSWMSPFIKQSTQLLLEKLVFLIQNQFTGEPLLDTKKTLNEQFFYETD